ncbi:MAG: fatty acid cis/trans isomerase [Pseudomonadales bacterium]|nr:fatty acid cis/trans isomerase [Pseudomonadales bacterium]
MIPLQAKSVLAIVFLLLIANGWADATQYSESTDVKRILDTRCVVCHGCYDAPCQLKLGAYEGLLRGATPQTVYNPSRFSEDITTRLFIDGRSVTDWRKLGFHEVVTAPSALPTTTDYQDDLLYRLITQTPQNTFSSRREITRRFPVGHQSRTVLCGKSRGG